MKALDRKLWRELWQLKGQAAAIALVIVCGVAIHVMFGATLDALGQTRARYYREHRFADVFAALKRAPEALRERIAALPGVAEVETRVVAGIHLEVAGFADTISIDGTVDVQPVTTFCTRNSRSIFRFPSSAL